MALVAWYPLNGNLENKGAFGDILSNKGAIVNDFGKIGKCYDTTNNCLYTYNFPIMSGDSSYSIWAKSTKENKMLSGMPYTIGMTNNKYVDFAFLNDRKVAWNIGDEGSNTFNTVYGNALTFYETPIDGNWHHYVVTNNKSSGKATLFVDGNEVGYAYYREPTSTGLVIGEYLNASTAYLFKGLLNDFRAYDHILSKAEIKEIYKTPILKYSFDYPAINPLISTATKTEYDISSLFDGGTNRCPDIGKVIYNNAYVIDNNYFTISFDIEIKDLTVADGSLGKLTLQDNTYDAVLETKKWNTITTTDIKNRSNIFLSSDGTKEINLSENGKYHIVRTYQLKDTARFIQNWNIQIRVDNISGGIATISNFRVVLGKNEIPYDGTGNIFYDETGLGSNGILVGADTFLPTSYSTESKYGEGCYVSKTKTDLAENTYGIIKIPNFYEVQELSICFWVYVPLTDNNTDSNTFIGYSASASNYGLWIRRVSTRLTATVYGKEVTTSGIQRAQWNYIVVTAQKTGDIKLYINGEMKTSGTIESGIDWADATLTIGDLRENKGLGFDGKLDDLIIYSTIISDDEIKKQYLNSTKIDNNGNLYCKEIIEKNNVITINGQGEVICSSINEGYNIAKIQKNNNIFEVNEIYEI